MALYNFWEIKIIRSFPYIFPYFRRIEGSVLQFPDSPVLKIKWGIKFCPHW